MRVNRKYDTLYDTTGLNSISEEDRKIIFENAFLPIEDLKKLLKNGPYPDNLISWFATRIRRILSNDVTQKERNTYGRIESDLLLDFLKEDNNLLNVIQKGGNIRDVKYASGSIDNIDKDYLKAYVNILNDPVKWAETILTDPDSVKEPLKLRAWQKEVIYAMKVHDKVSLRIARRCGKSVAIAVFALWYCATQNNKKVVLLAPYESQVRVLWDIIFRLVSNSPLIKSSMMVFRKRNPFEISFRNGSYIKGFTTAERSTKGATLRGSDAELMIIDEADFISSETLGTILAIISGSKDMKLIVSSTPSGKRSFFYDTQTKPELGFWTKHLTVYEANPNWTIERERFYKRLYAATPWVYEREYEAEFGDEVEGVFSHDDINASLYRYKYEDMVYDKDNLYFMGVDWNTPKVGDRIVVLEYMKNKNIFRVVYHKIIQGNSFVQDKTIEEILRLNEKFPCEYIYVDYGYGHTAIEDLKNLAKKRNIVDFEKKVVAIEFGRLVEIWDYAARKAVKKVIKPLMVEMFSRLLSMRKFRMSSSEDNIGLLAYEMRNLRVKKTGPLNIPIYEDENCHSIYALMLSFFAYIMNHSVYSLKVKDRGINVFNDIRVVNILKKGQEVETTKKTLEIDSTSDIASQKIQQAVNNLGIPYSQKIVTNAQSVNEANKDDLPIANDNNIKLVKFTKRDISNVRSSSFYKRKGHISRRIF